MTSDRKKPVDQFYKLLGNGRSSSKTIITLRDSSDSLQLSTTSSFYNKNKKSESYLTLIQMLKNDLFQIQDMINSNSKDIKMFKLLSKSPGLSKKLSEIEKNRSIDDLIQKINEISQKHDKILKIYGCKDNKQLIPKIFFELNLYELLFGKIQDFFILMKLSLHKDDTYQESMSKIILMKNFLDKTIEKLNEKNDINNKNIENNYKIIKDILDKIKSLSDLINNEINNDNEEIKNIFGYIIKLINEFFVSKNKYILDSVDINIKNNDFENKSDIEKFEKIFDELVNLNKKYILDNIKIKEQNESLIKEIDDIKNQNTDIINLKSQFETEKNELLQNLENSDTKYKNLENEYNILNEESTKMISELNILKENELKNNFSLENELKIKNEQITNLQKLNSDLNNKVKELNKKIIELNNQIQDLENKKNNYVDINESIKNSELMKIMANHDAELKKLGNDLMNQNKTEIKNLENKLKSLQAKYDMILIECSNLKKNIIYLKGKKYDPDSYEEVLKEQFETMRNAFVIKIDDLNEELTSIKRESRVKIYQLELDLKENIKLKNTFLKQIISLQSQLDALNKE
jgi:hypothetical protein